MNDIARDLADLRRSVSSLSEDPANARAHDDANIQAIASSLRRFGQQKPIVANAEGVVIAGNGTLRAARDVLGWTEVAVTTFSGDTAVEATAYAIADNQTAALASWDEDRLVETLDALEEDGFPVDILAFDDEELDRMRAEALPDIDPGDVEEPPVPDNAPTRAKPGDLWLLGEHRLVCGDCLSESDLTTALGGASADLVFTDPPYNVDLSSLVTGVEKRNRKGDDGTIANDKMTDEDFARFMADVVASMHRALKPGGVWYVCSPAGPDETAFRIALQAVFDLRQAIVWAKDVFVFGRQDYHWRHETLLYGWKDGGPHYFVDDRTQDTVWEIARPRSSPEHPTMKPIELVAKALSNSSRPGELVLDLFGGSGSTLMAAEQLGRKAALVEIEPRFCDVILARWEQLTGKVAQRAE